MKCPWCGHTLKIELKDQRDIIMTNGKPYPEPWGYEARCPMALCGYMRGSSWLPDEIRAMTLDSFIEV